MGAWLSARFGRRNLILGCLTGFTIASMLCGLATSLTQIVLFRLLQGMFGAALVPLSQTTMLDLYPVEQRGSAMALWGMGVMVGPILGPTLGGYLTDILNWRYVFFINLPFGLLAIAGLWLFMKETKLQDQLRFDWSGFAYLSLALASLQMMLDRGEQKDWFHSTEIVVELVLACLGLYLFVVHMATTTNPFIPPRIFKDQNFGARGALRRVLFHHVCDGFDSAGERGADAALSAEPQWLFDYGDGIADGAARARHDVLDDAGGTAGEPRRSTPADAVRGDADLRLAMGDGGLDAGRE